MKKEMLEFHKEKQRNKEKIKKREVWQRKKRREKLKDNCLRGNAK